MAWPAGVTTKTVKWGIPFAIDDPDANVTVTATIETKIAMVGAQDDEWLVWDPTGQPAIPVGKTNAAVVDGYATLVLPVCDQAGWKFRGVPVDVTGGKMSHWYFVTLEFYVGNAKKPVKSKKVGPFVVLTSDPAEIDGDEIVATNSSAGTPISMSDYIATAAVRNDAGVAELIGNPSAGPQTQSALRAGYASVITPEKYGAVGDGVADDTAAVVAAANALAAAARPGLTGTIWQPGARLDLRGTYNLATLSAPLVLTGDVDGSRAKLIVPAAYAGVAVLVGHATSGSYLQNARVALPDVTKPPASMPNPSSLVAGSVGVRLQNIGNSDVILARTTYFETGVNCSGDGQGTAYNRIHIGWISYCKVSLTLKPHTASGWCNQNTFIAGGIQQSTGWAGGSRIAGWRHVVIDGSAGQYVNGNTFVGTSFEGDVSEFWLEAKSAANNEWIGTRHETGSSGTAVTAAASSATLTATAHGLAVGDMVTFSATSVPGGMVVASPYFVTSVPDANTFMVSTKKGGTAVTFTSAGSAVKFFRPPTMKLDQTGNILQNNIVRDPFTPQGVMGVVNTATSQDGNVVERPGRILADIYAPDGIPAVRARNTASSPASRAVIAAYGATVNPVEDPQGWGAALADFGLLWAASGAETGRLTNAGGVLSYKRPADTATYEIPSARRSSALTAVTALSCPAGATTVFTFTLTGASVNDHCHVTPDSALPSGIAIAYARVSAADTVAVGFLNATAGAISLTCQLNAIAIRRFY